ncbi:uncharacterized protein C8R40DRAFT_522858 [Lentinula edodes]|uniref:uncharacterized protein n=1 Tax=Lentinula edodes TaxID=5353 RepID=UPI001E8DB977|nr:uncharacterized protein C8R40DRAFT_522858 [Lentinula edodes]KAH7872062.1 hypothetical protein C8R40DRAFT_522858 [Lentinula edodes]
MHFNKLVVYLFLGSVSSAVSAPPRCVDQNSLFQVNKRHQREVKCTSSSTQVVVPVESLAATEALDDGWVLVPRPTPGQDPAPTTSEPEHHEPHPADPTTLPEPQYSSAPGEISLGKRPKLITVNSVLIHILSYLWRGSFNTQGIYDHTA